MDRIHKKTVLPETSTLILGAHDAGAELLWDRYEQQLPLCGFTSNGLNCRKCFQGPCRINPFGDEPSRGICGADRDQIVMESLFQATLDGVLESARMAALLAPGEAGHELPELGAALSPAASARLSQAGLLPVKKADLFAVQNSYFSHKSYLASTLGDLTRLGLINLDLLAQAGTAAARQQTNSFPLGTDAINVLILGHPPFALSHALEAERSGEKRINLIAGGAAPDHGSPELVLGAVDVLLVAADAAWPAVEPLAKRYGVPALIADPKRTAREVAAEVIDQACRHAQTAARPAGSSSAAAPASARPAILEQKEALRAGFAAGRFTGAVVILGEANVKQSFFERTLALMEAALGARALVLLGGELGSQTPLLTTEIERRKSGLLSTFAAELRTDGLAPISCFGSAFEIPQLVGLLNGLGEERQRPPVVAALPEFFRSSTWASAVSFLALGYPVQIGVRLPFWGSPPLLETITREWQRLTDGRLLAGPSLPSPAAQADELVGLLKAGSAD